MLEGPNDDIVVDGRSLASAVEQVQPAHRSVNRSIDQTTNHHAHEARRGWPIGASDLLVSTFDRVSAVNERCGNQLIPYVSSVEDSKKKPIADAMYLLVWHGAQRKSRQTRRALVRTQVLP
jgi:hypothetical protein